MSVDFRYPALGVSTIVGTIGITALGASFLIGGAKEASDTWSTGSVATASTQTMAVAVFAILCATIALRMLRAGVFAQDDTLIVRQLSRTRRFARQSIRGAQITTAPNFFRSSAVLEIQLDEDHVQCQLYGLFLNPDRAESIATSISRWCADTG